MLLMRRKVKFEKKWAESWELSMGKNGRDDLGRI